MNSSSDLIDKRLESGRKLLNIEAQSILRASQNLDASFIAALDLIEKTLASKLKLVLLGVGKSHYVAQKLVASFLSTGVNAVFIHPAEALHGDLGAINPGDLCLCFSKSGNTGELISLLPFLKGRNPIISLTGSMDSQMAKFSDVVLDASVEQEACPINMVPTASTTVAMALGDALVSVLAERRGFSKESFAHFHPGGSIGKRLTMKVSQVALSSDRVPMGSPQTPLKEVALAMGQKPVGAFCVIGPSGEVVGIIVEGDIRRVVAREVSISGLMAKDLMTTKFIHLNESMLVGEALEKMESKGRLVSTAPVLDSQFRLKAFVRLQDLL